MGFLKHYALAVGNLVNAWGFGPKDGRINLTRFYVLLYNWSFI
jgi:hypothetical protein